MGKIRMQTWQLSRRKAKTDGFALPTVLIISIILLAIGASTLQLASAISRSLTDQHWNREAKLAAQAGVSFASSCLSAGVTTWSSLVPNKKCDGTTTLSPDPGIYIGSDMSANASPGRWRSTFTVATPATGADGVPRVDIIGKVEVVTLANIVVKTYTYSYNAVISLAGIASSQAASQISTIGLGTDASSCEVAADQRVYCSGDNGKGNFGTGNTTPSLVPVLFGTGGSPSPLAGKLFTDVSVGYRYTCAVTTERKIYCAGENGSGQLGNGNQSQQLSPVQFGPGIPSGSSRFVRVSAGTTHTCGVNNIQEIYCAGSNSNGQIGNNGGLGVFPVPQKLLSSPTGKKFTQVSVGDKHTCALSTEQYVYCTGLNTSGQLGRAGGQSLVAVKFAQAGVASALTFSQVSAGLNSTCALSATTSAATDKFIYCAGSDASFGLGDGGLATDQAVPVRSFNTGVPTTGKKFNQVSVGGASHICALGEDALIYCVGNNSNYQLGDGTAVARTDPVKFGDIGPTLGVTYMQVSAGSLYTCGLATNGAIYCTGNNSDGQQGSTTLTPRTQPDSSMLIP